MRLLLQRVSQASVSVEGSSIASIGSGYLLFLCVMEGDLPEDAQKLAQKVSALRLFEGPDGKINDRSILETGGEILVVSQFTLAGSTEKGNRPDYTRAAKPDDARPLYTQFIDVLQSMQISVATGEFGAHMQVTLTNDGPVTLLLEQPG